MSYGELPGRLAGYSGGSIRHGGHHQGFHILEGRMSSLRGDEPNPQLDMSPAVG